MTDDFYIGWESKAPTSVARKVRKVVITLIMCVLAAAGALAVSQRLIGNSVFEWGKQREFAGVLKVAPYPHLVVTDARGSTNRPAFPNYYLVAPWKFGLNRKAIAALEGKAVSLRGTLIHRDNQAMIETKPEWIVASTNAPEVVPLEAARTAQRAVPTIERLGRRTFVGEIVDSKCFLGVMNPGQLTPHRACAIRCISGGVPPVLLVRQVNGPPVYLLLVSAEGNPVNNEVLDLIAEPVEITGEVERQNDLLILRADPKTYRRR